MILKQFPTFNCAVIPDPQRDRGVEKRMTVNSENKAAKASDAIVLLV